MKLYIYPAVCGAAAYPAPRPGQPGLQEAIGPGVGLIFTHLSMKIHGENWRNDFHGKSLAAQVLMPLRGAADSPLPDLHSIFTSSSTPPSPSPWVIPVSMTPCTIDLTVGAAIEKERLPGFCYI